DQVEPHEDLDDLGHRDAERLREVADGDAGLDGNGAGGLDRRRRTRFAGRTGLLPAARAPVLTRTRRLVVDDDAAPAVARAAAAAGAERTVRFPSVCHQSPSV